MSKPAPPQSFWPPLAIYVPPIDDQLEAPGPLLRLSPGFARLYQPLAEFPIPWCDCPFCEDYRRVLRSPEGGSGA